MSSIFTQKKFRNIHLKTPETEAGNQKEKEKIEECNNNWILAPAPPLSGGVLVRSLPSLLF